MRDSPSDTTIRLRIGDDEIVIRSPDEFEFALRPRLDVRSLKHAQLSVLSDDALSEELAGVRALEKVLLDVIAQSMSDPGRVGKFIKRLNLNLVTMDNDWREIFATIAKFGSRLDAYKRVALIQYLEYLGQRKDLIKSVQERRNLHRARHPAEHSPSGEHEPADQRRSAQGVFGPQHGSPVRAAFPGGSGMGDAARLSGSTLDQIQVGALDDTQERSNRERLIFDPAELSRESRRGVTFGRMPKGMAVPVEFGVHQALSLMLAMYDFWIVSGDPFRLVDSFGHDIAIPQGKSVVGRNVHIDVPVDQSYNVVSRRHLMLDLERSGKLTLTDMSSYGTYLPVALLNAIV